MKNTTARRHCTSSVMARALYLSFELALKKWKLGFITGLGDKPRIRTIAAGNLTALAQEMAAARRHFKLAEDAAVRSCYEAGREAFSLHRALIKLGIDNLIMDSSSIEVPRRRRATKSDRLDVAKLGRLLFRYHNGERQVCSVVRVPSPQDEDRRQLHREMDTLKAEQTALSGRIKSLLVTQGVYWPHGIGRLSRKPLREFRTLDGQALGPGLQARLGREIQRWRAAGEQLRELQRQRREILDRQANEPFAQLVLTLLKLRAIGVESAWLLVMELFSWREFQNRRQVGAMSGMTGVHHGSGDTLHDQGISQRANYRVRALLVELAWLWLRYQPHSELSRWYQERFGSGSKRVRKIGIVAVARRLTIALWRFLEFGEIPAGAELRVARPRL